MVGEGVTTLPYFLKERIMRDQPYKKLRLWLMAALTVLLVQPALAQDGAFISLNTDTTTLQTGQIYEVRVSVENVTNLWVTSFEISYDPKAIYIMGTRAGRIDGTRRTVISICPGCLCDNHLRAA